MFRWNITAYFPRVVTKTQNRIKWNAPLISTSFCTSFDLGLGIPKSTFSWSKEGHSIFLARTLAYMHLQTFVKWFLFIKFAKIEQTTKIPCHVVYTLTRHNKPESYLLSSLYHIYIVA